MCKNLIIKEINVKNIISVSKLPTGGFCANPYVGCTHSCKYCYACFMKKFTNHNENWGEFLDVKSWNKIKNIEKYEGKRLFIGSVTDPYNEDENTYKKTRKLLEEFKGLDIRLHIATKSDLILRDLDIIKTFKDVSISFSVNTLDENFKNDMDKAPSINRRLSAMKKIYDEKIRTSCFVAPIFPAITDVFAIIRAVKNSCNSVWLENLNLRGVDKNIIFDYIKQKYPDLLKIYTEIYNNKNNAYWKTLDELIYKYCKKYGLKYVVNEDVFSDFGEFPTVVNFFYHEKIKR